MWEYRGIKGGGQPPSYLGKYHGNLIILGGARCVWSDFQKLKDTGYAAQVMAVNDVGMYFDQSLDHWVSMHANFLSLWAQLRKGHSLMGHECLTHTREPYPGIRVAWDLQPYGFESGLFAAQVGLCLGYEQIVLCGVPQDGSGHFYDPPWMPGGEHSDGNGLKAFRHIVEQTPELRRSVRSMSGWTKELLGEP